MRKKLSVEDHLPGIQIFLNLFDLTLDSNAVQEKNALFVYQNNIQMGTILFQENQIIINSLSPYGMLTCNADYAEVFTMLDHKSSKCTYANWTHSFDFLLQHQNGATTKGKFYLHIKIDSEYGNLVKAQCRLNYIENEKKYDIQFHQNGYQFQFFEQRNMMKERLKYSLEGSSTGVYIQHLKFDKLKQNEETYNYYENSHISKNIHNQLSIVLRKEFDEICTKYHRQEVSLLDTDIIVQIANFMNLFSPNTKQKVNHIIQEFSVDGHSFLENLFCTCFHFYTEEQLEALFGIPKWKIDLEETYFKDNLETKILKYSIQ